MNIASKYLTAIAMLTVSMLANAANETLEYQGSLMTGSETSWNGENPVTNPFTGTYTAFLNVSSDSSNTWSIGSWAIDLNGNAVLSGTGNGVDPGHVPIANIGLDESGGSVVGADIVWSFNSQGPGASNTAINVGSSSGDSYLFATDCDRNSPGGGGRCGTTLSNSTAGTWTVMSPAAAPEIDPASMASALTLLAGFVVMTRGRRRTVSWDATKHP